MTKDVLINLDRTRRIRFDINALADAEDALGKSLGKALASDAGFKELRALLWAGLRRDDRTLTIERTGDLMQAFIENGGSLDEIGVKIGDAIKASGLLKDRPDDEGNA